MRKLLGFASVLVLASSLGAAALFAASAPSFTGPTNYATGSGPVSVAIGDLNGDGKPDVAVANGRSSTVSVLANRGDGRFRPRLDYRTGAGPASVAIGDVNGDGKLDLTVANASSSTVSVLANKGDGGFQAGVNYRTGRFPVSVAIGDLSGDGKADLAIANFDANTVSVLANSGDGSFGAKLDYRTGSEPYSVAIGDLNGDGKPDLVAANLAGTVSVLANRGDGRFGAKHDYRTGGFPFSIAIGDLNGDGKPDLATADGGRLEGGSDTVSVLLNAGDGSFRARVDYRTGSGPESVAISDLNGDGKPDLATANNGVDATNGEPVSTVSVLANKGDGHFRAKLDYRTGTYPRSVAIRDLNGDGKGDIVTASVENSVSVLTNTPGLCTVQDVKGRALPAAKRTIAHANCRVGKIRHAYSKTVKRGRVISEKPRPGTVLSNLGKVNLVVSRGRRR